MIHLEETTRQWCERYLAEIYADGAVIARFSLQGREGSGHPWSTFGSVDRPESAKNIRAAADTLYNTIEREVLNSKRPQVRVLAWLDGGRHPKATKMWPVFREEDEHESDNIPGDKLLAATFAQTLRHNEVLIRHTTHTTTVMADRLSTALDRSYEEIAALRAEKAAFVQAQQDMLDRSLDRQLKAQRQTMLVKAAEAVVAVLQWKLTGAKRPEGGDDFVKAATALTDSLGPEQLAEFAASGTIRFNATQQQAVALLLSANEPTAEVEDSGTEPLPAAPKPKSKLQLGVSSDTLRSLKQRLAPERYGEALDQLNGAVALLRDPLAALSTTREAAVVNDLKDANESEPTTEGDDEDTGIVDNESTTESAHDETGVTGAATPNNNGKDT